jgi:hypothetical protein
VKGCPDHARIQDHLEGLLSGPELASWLDHVRGCDTCAAESVRFQRLFTVLSDLPVVPEPSPALTERILAAVVPQTSRHRWLVRFGWGYAGAFAGCAAAVGVLAFQPASRSFLAWVSTEASGRIVSVLSFILHAVSFAAVNLASSGTALTRVGERLGPFAKVLGMILSLPSVALALGMSAAVCIALYLWLKPSSGQRGKGVRHVGLLGI